MHTEGFQFSDLRQKQIYEELRELVGPGPAAFFRDACWLMSNPGHLETTAHLVGHCLREIESAIRQVYLPLAKSGFADQPERSDESSSMNQKEQIRVILGLLGIQENTPEAKAWFEFADKLHGIAHRRGLDVPRPVSEIKEFWESSQLLLQILLRALREKFLLWIEILDQLLKKPRPAKEDLKRLSQEVPNNRVARQHFFDRLENPEWLEPLWKRGFFKHPPQPERNEEEGTVRFPPWPEARYLARMAKCRPELVAQIIREMDSTDNAAVISDLVDVLLAIPANISAGLVEKAKQWAECPYLLVPEKVGQFIAYLANGGKAEEAMGIARILLEVFPYPEPELAEAERVLLPLEPRARFDIWIYEEILKKHYPELVKAAGLPALELLCDLLDKAIQLSRRRDDDIGEDLSFIWRPAIEDHPQNRGHTIKDALVSAVRDAAEQLVRSGKASIGGVVNVLEKRGWKLFQRMALHIIRLFQDQSKELAAAKLTVQTLFEDISILHEYTLLLQDRFSYLSPEDQAKVFKWVEAGPEVGQWKEWRERETGQQPSEEEVIRYRELWQRDWLARIGLENLPREWRQRYHELVEKYGEPKHPEFVVYSEESVGVGPTSPKTAEELKAMSVSEIVEFLKTWKPTEKALFGPSPQGLGRELSSVVAEEPDRFAKDALMFQGLDPTYIRNLVFGFAEAVKRDKVFDWEPVLKLCKWVVSQSREITGRRVDPMQADPDWGWARKAIADLLSSGFEDRARGIPIRLRQEVWGVLKPLTEDSDPTPDHEQRFGGSNIDPVTLSINTTRGKAMHAVIRYALWVLRHLEKEPNGKDRLTKGLSEMPEVREVLEAHLDLTKEPSLAIRAVYGQWFPWLVLLDPDWARNQAPRIFPQEPEKRVFLLAAWNAYIMFCRPYDNVLEILRPFYDMAADQISVSHGEARRPPDCDEKLAEHLMVFYWRGKLSFKDPLLVKFWEKAPDALRAHAIAFVGQALKQTEGGVSAEILDRLKRLWERRFRTAKKSQNSSDFERELSAFGWWFISGKFEAKWALDRLFACLQIAHKAEPTHMVLEALAEKSKDLPLEALQCLRLIAEGDKQGWELYASRDNIRRIIQLSLGNTKAKQEAERLIHYLGSRGFLDLRNFLIG